MCNADVARAASETELLISLCTTLVTIGGYPLAWVGRCAHADHSVRAVAMAGGDFAQDYVRHIEVSWRDDPLGRGPTGTAARSGRTAVNRNSETNPDYGPWRDQALAHGFRSSIAVPLGAPRLGVLTVYAHTPDAFDDEERALLEQLAENAGRGIEAIRTRAALARTEEQLRHVDEARIRFAILDESPNAFMAIDRAWRYLYINEVGARQVGHTAQSLVGRVIWEAFPQAVGSPFEDAYRRAMDQGETVELEAHFEHLAAWFVVRVYPIGLGIAVHFADVTKRKELELALRESEARFRQLAASIDEVFWLTDPDKTKYFYLSPAFETLFGRSADSVRTLDDWMALVHPDDRERLRERLPAQRLGGWDETFRVLRPDGTTRWVRGRAYPVRDERGEVYRIAGVVRDITATQRLEELYRHAQKMEAVGRLAGGVAHDFNNLLSIILTYCELSRETLPEGDPVREALDEIEHAGERAADLTRRLLAFSRQQVLAPRVIDLGETLLGMQKMLRRLLGADVELTLTVGAGSGRVFADAGQIEQIVMNLAVNARDAMPRGGRLAIEVSGVDVGPDEAASRGMKAGRYVRLTVTDDGVGMTPETKERIFEPFFTTKETGKGTGLGLSTVFGIVQQSGGYIAVETAVGRGTTFRIDLPRTDQPPDSAAPAPPESRTIAGSETILLVEDDERVRVMMCTVLRRAGYQVLDASNAGEALLISEKHPGKIHLLVTDVVMPKVGGPELVSRLVPARPDTRVLYVSGYTDDQTLCGVASYLPKPITPEQLLRKVRGVLDGPPESARRRVGRSPFAPGADG